MKQSRKAAKVAYQGLKELVKFGKFAEVENNVVASSINVEVVDEHVAPKSNPFAFEEVEISDDEEEEIQENDMTENELEVFLQSISIPEEDVVVTPSAVTERDRDSTPPQTVHVTTKPPSESDQEDSSHVLLPRKRKRRDPRPRLLIIDPIQNVSTPIEPSSVAQTIESTFTESSLVMQEISSPLPKSTSMDQDFESPIVEKEVLPSERAQPSGSSFEAPGLDNSKGKSKLPESEFMDVALLQNRVVDLEQSLAEKDLIIGNQDIRISDLEKENSIKDAKISELQANIGGLTALFFDLKQRLHQKFDGDFQPLSAEGENTFASSSGPINPTCQPASEIVVRPAPDANLDTFLSSGPASAQERREKCSGVDYDGMCEIRQDLVNHHVNSRTQGVNKFV
ncbi:unnamed protein product [Lactuca virosa]|uniref:Uncharacterized protein n=1 Tax=Lactuca virosa TaxID=75947 RepID=A0AAU9MUZ8_9ASTR|nr:unnamed protein product [Lactuca virosa]